MNEIDFGNWSRREADRIELTLAVKDTEKFSEAVCAFANDLPGRGMPGYLVIGVGDQACLAACAPATSCCATWAACATTAISSRCPASPNGRRPAA